MPTKPSQVSLAAHQTQRRLDPRMAMRRLRVALSGVVTSTPEPRHFWDDVRRKEPRAALPFEKEREMIHGAIQQGCTTPERIIAYRITQLQDDLAQFDETPPLEDRFYQHLVCEMAESMDAVSRAHALPTQANREAAVRETAEAVTFAQAFIQLLRAGGSMLHLSH